MARKTQKAITGAQATEGMEFHAAPPRSGMEAEKAVQSMVPVDGHVHFHALERVVATLDAAAANFRVHGQRDSGLLGILLLTQSSRERVFEALREQRSCGPWTLRTSSGEDESLRAEHRERRIVVVCGRQIRCERGLEVTALGTTEVFPDGLSLEETICEVQARGALVSLPWGFGKWLGARGQLVRDSLRRHPPGSLAICDNGGRLAASGQPSLVRECGALGYPILPGTDPFPFGSDYLRAGSFGFLAAEPDQSTPWRGLAEWLQSLGGSPPAYGRALGPLKFLVNNVGIQVYNRTRPAQNP